jgi:hypothetical protein
LANDGKTEVSEWQPIETAPKDGTRIDIWEFCHDPAWRDETGIENGTRIVDVWWQDGEWMAFNERDGDVCGVGFNEHYTVSHWMPVPPPPPNPS